VIPCTRITKISRRVITLTVFSEHQQLRDWLSLNDAIDAESGQIPCRQAPDLYFPDKIGDGMGYDNTHLKMAIRACHTCPVINQCAEYAIRHKETAGIWGGMSTSQRKALWKDN
jgi:hypothetical protein